MGNKVNPIGYRIPLNPTLAWKSRWFSTRPAIYKAHLGEDVLLRKTLMKKLAIAGVNRVEIERSLKSMKIIIFVSRPGVVIGRGGSGLEDLKKFIVSKLKTTSKIELQVEEVKQPDLSAYLVATRVAEQLEKRMSSRRVAKKTIEKCMLAGAGGVKILIAGRINGAEIARRELYNSPTGSVPLQTLRADIDYAQVPALTRSGYVGVKVWIFKGEK
ncbi:MAG: 30S ribosomal protein S3 [Candidatus Amesbacteria bacterium GW2011_GWA2_42_12]|uniref:Small ribosomal subunit protein uS3 n=1 Tax=Candidatus Amesbacteria bacterium GW2011_GWA2_42_12 TaxID=1618356 RepID=A0A0G0Y974_9BACT|nr:MAG: 30S ribosomal protein S3 [Candidatus Amesbacteria bacterium GW2011_GWA2_42_12]